MLRPRILLGLFITALVALSCESEGEGQRGASTKCAPGATKACVCTDGSSGQRVCRDDESWGACACAPTSDTVSPEDTSDDGSMKDVVTLDGCDPLCAGKTCGPDGCGGFCGTCPMDQFCVDGECSTTCTPVCDERECGDDGCGGYACGVCADGWYCQAHECIQGVCDPLCDDRQCGDDGCGGSCGQCPYGSACSQGQCVCVPECLGKTCGPDGCGSDCGACPADSECVEGFCEGGCDQSCAGKVCGDDGCGGSCGTCATGSCVGGECKVTGPWDLGFGGRVHVAWSPSDANGGGEASGAYEIFDSICPDITGDGQADNALGPVVAQLPSLGVDANAMLNDALQSGSTDILLDFQSAVTAPNVPFFFAAYGGVPPGSGSYQASAFSFSDDGQPLYGMSGASTDYDGHLSAGPSDVTLPVPLSGMVFDLDFAKAMASGWIAEATDDGVGFESGALGGAIFKADIAVLLEEIKDACAYDPSSSAICENVGMLEMGLIESFLQWDLDIPGCGKTYNGATDCSATSLCIFFATEPVTLAGITNAAPNLDCGCDISAGPVPSKALAASSIFAFLCLLGLALLRRQGAR